MEYYVSEKLPKSISLSGDVTEGVPKISQPRTHHYFGLCMGSIFDGIRGNVTLLSLYVRIALSTTTN